jgi:transcriptional regulator with XRE-family HTH domain
MGNKTAEIFSKKLREARESRGLTQQQLAERLDMGWQKISRWERGIRFPDPEELDSLCSHLGEPVHWFFEEEARNEPFEERFKTIQRHLDQLEKEMSLAVRVADGRTTAMLDLLSVVTREQARAADEISRQRYIRENGEPPPSDWEGLEFVFVPKEEMATFRSVFKGPPTGQEKSPQKGAKVVRTRQRDRSWPARDEPEESMQDESQQ